jgi:hypothetical protein
MEEWGRIEGVERLELMDGNTEPDARVSGKNHVGYDNGERALLFVIA